MKHGYAIQNILMLLTNLCREPLRNSNPSIHHTQLTAISMSLLKSYERQDAPKADSFALALKPQRFNLVTSAVGYV